MTTKEYLEQVKTLDLLIDSKILQVESLRELSTKITSTLQQDKVNTYTVPDRTALIVKIVDLEHSINDDIDRLVDLKKEILETLDMIYNDKYRILLSLRYISYKTHEQIAEKLDCHVNNVYWSLKKAFIVYEKAKKRREGF